MSPQIRRLRDAVEIALDGAEAELLDELAGQLRPMLTGEAPSSDPDPIRERLFPRAYLDPTEVDAEDDWQLAVHGELVREKLEALDALTRTLAAAPNRWSQRRVRLSFEDAERWLTALNDARLALGTRLGVTEDIDYATLPDDERPAFEVYGWLTYLQGELVEVLTTGE